MDEFEMLLKTERSSVERFVRFRINSGPDADDVLQEIYLTAYSKFAQLKNTASFKAWIISIARNKCSDYFRKKALQPEISIDELNDNIVNDNIVTESFLTGSSLVYMGMCDCRLGASAADPVRDTMELLGDKDKQILYLYFWKELTQAEIAGLLNIPVGTVKSRLYTAKQNFKNRYPYHDVQAKGDNSMKKLPGLMPEYKITESTEAPFSVKWEELMGWFLIPRPGEKISWGMYDIPSRKCSHIYDMKVTGKARVHGIEGVELTAREACYTDKKEVTNRTIVAQLTDTHCRYLATLRTDGDVRNYITFLDGDDFMLCWGFGEDNIGHEINLAPKGDICRTGTVITSKQKEFLLDIVGRYTVTINGKSYDTVCVLDIESCDSGVVSEQFLDRNGKTILWRRWNRDNWDIERYKKRWIELLPENERFTINGTTYVHWYDCITDYIL